MRVLRSRNTPLNWQMAATSPKSMWPLLTFAAVLSVAYGYEIFSFHLTLDEELFGEKMRGISDWVAEGRWAMAGLYLLLPSPVVPVISTSIGIGLSGAAWWILCRRYLAMTPWQSAFGASLAATIPVLAFIFSFSTIAYGIGAGHLLLIAYMRGLNSRTWVRRGVGVVAGAAAVGIYDSFLVALAALSLALVIRRTTVASSALVIAAPVAAFLVSRGASAFVLSVSNVRPSGYGGQFLELSGLLAHPLDRFGMALSNLGKTLLLSTERFGLHSPWLAVALAALSILAIVGIWRESNSGPQRVVRLVALLGLVALPLAAEAASPVPVQLRSMLYLTTITLILSSFGLRSLAALPKFPGDAASPVIAGLIILAVAGNATISNRLFAASETAFALDQELAFAIGYEKERLLPNSSNTSVPVVVSGRHGWPQSHIKPARETLGVSFFAWSGAAARVPAFLSSQGVRAQPATATQSAQSWQTLDEMPSYPQPGWVRVKDGVLLLKFGPRTPE